MRVRKLARAKGCGVFDDYTWPTTLPELQDRVVVYGWNGAGKTTLASILREAETRRPAFSGGAWEIATDSAPIRSGSLSEDAQPLPIRVFDSDFVADSVFATGELAPVLYVGKGTRAKQERLEECAAELEQAEDKLRALAESKAKADRDLEQFYTDQAKLIKEALRSSGSNPYNNYDKGAYRQRVQALRTLAQVPSLLSVADRSQFRSAKDTQAMPPVSLLGKGVVLGTDLEREARQILATTPMSAPLERLSKDPAVGRWAEAGLQLHEERHSEACLFCTAPLNPETLADLQRHFDVAFRELVESTEALLGQVRSVRAQAEAIEPPLALQVSPGLRQQYEASLVAFSRNRVDFVAAVRSIEAGLLAKRDAPFEAIALDPVGATPLSIDVGNLNMVIATHNEEQSDLSARIARARASLADDLILQQWTRINRLEAQIDSIGGNLVAAVEARDSLRAEELALKQDVVEHVTPATQLTAELAAFLGREDITFQPSGTGYIISRFGQRAQGLSEGEKSAIALLYFLKTLRDRSFNRAEGVVVIDDPISSLDSNALYCALGYIQAETAGIGQLIFLTHNFAFFRELRRWLNPKRPPIPCSLYFMRCAGLCDPRQAVIEPLDDLLRDYDSEYQYLFKLIWEAAKATDSASLARLFHYPNVARRLLEAFFAFRMPDVSQGGLRGRLKQTNLDAARRERMLRFLDFQSHDDGVDVPEDDLSSLAEAPVVLREVLDLMKEQDSGHFERMTRLVTATREDG